MAEKTNIDLVVQDIVAAVNQMREPIKAKQNVNLLSLADELDQNIRKLGQVISHCEKECDNRYSDLETSLRNLSTAKELTYRGHAEEYSPEQKQDELSQLLSTVSRDLSRYSNT